MVARKEIIILNGGGHKGIVKISAVAGRDDIVKVSCSLDFRPNNAKLYLIGDNVAQMALNDTNCDGELSFSAKSEIGCVLRSSSVTMFGGGGSKSEMLKRIETSNASARPRQAAQGKEQNNITPAFEDTNAQKTADVCRSETAKVAGDMGAKGQEQFVGTSARTEALSEWTKYDGNNFYYAVKPQIDEMFVCYPEETILVASVPNSKWVRVDAEDGCYVVGLLFDEDEPSFICYGVPQPRTELKPQAPPELENMCVWLPLDVSEDIMGYWIIYQSARTGEIVK